ncbi:splicing factor Cactin isoform X2 [Onychostoma macrolepis]|uniref:splicing factor Cactin isoform X2 n=1 Tax=Onychostoma macrolepis TaxID=369639 RepID=UPI00272C586A|nr:splicing factor Cactin isoform X2 [Onychostoma macrolepis]
MGPKKHRRSRSRSRSPERSRRYVRSRSPEDRHGRNRSPVKGSRRRGRSDSGGSRSSGGSAGPSRHRGRESGHSSDSDRDHRDRRARSHRRSKDRDSSSGDNHNNQKKHKTKKKHKDEKSSRRRSRSSSRSSSESSAERNRARDDRSSEREQRRRPSRSSSREKDREGRSREGDRDRRGRSESRSSSSSSSSADSDQGGKTTQGSSSTKEDKKKQKEMMKALETPEEKRARRLAKKEAKERKKREKMGWSEEYMGYTNADNPFGDNNLLGTFKWQKALEKKGIGHLSEKNLKERNKHIQVENRRELQKVKQLRLEREREKSMREQELEMLQREKEAEHFKTWAEQEDNFHLHQAKLRSKIRIRDGRAKPIDLLAKYISAEDDDLSVEMHEPYTFLNGLTATDMDDLLEDIKVYMELEQGKNVDFWRDMTTITEDEISKLRKLEASGKGPGDRREGINTSVSTDVQSVFKGKTYSQLQALYMNIENKIQAGGSNLDIGYWESLLQQVRVYMARARLRERHQDVLRQKLYKLKQEQGVESEPLFPIIKEEPENERPIPTAAESADEEPGSSQQGHDRDRRTKRQDGEEGERSGRSSPEEKKGGEGDKGGEEEGGKDEAPEAVLTEEDLIQQSQAEYDSGRYSPTLLQPSELPLDTHIINVEEDLQRLQLARRQLQVTGDANESAEDAFVRLAKEGMGGDEAQFSVEMPLTGKMYLWADKYRPRKPRFFNRVHTGFEWNKYNQTHYDFDNPPPKIVQGYKFNIFYPDLIDKRSTPQYFLEPCPDNKDFGILRFHAGPPYEDIAFKIVNREWEYSHRHGFRCQFANGIFQLWFHFKRYRYRR